MSKLNLIGEKFGDWTVIEKSDVKKGKRVFWKCRCKCGNTVDVAAGELRRGGSTKCRSCAGYASSTKHGEHRTRLYTTWADMKHRCNDKKNRAYGSRGITYCDEWEEYSVFSKWAKNNGYENDLTIERIDVNGNYCPENCKWISKKEQSKNKQNSLKLEYKGEVLISSDWSKKLGIPLTTIISRYYKGWDMERVLEGGKKRV